MPLLSKPIRDAVYDMTYTLPQPPPRLHWDFQWVEPLILRSDTPSAEIDSEALRKDFDAIIANRCIHETEGVVGNYRRLTENQKSVGWGIMGEVAKNLAPVPFNRHMGMYIGGLAER